MHPSAVAAAAERYFTLDIDQITDLVRRWCIKAHAPAFDAEGASTMANIIKEALATVRWRGDFKPDEPEQRGIERTLRVANALRTLKEDLPAFLEAHRLDDPEWLKDTINLMVLVGKHDFLLKIVRPRGRGRTTSPERDLSTYISRRASALWGSEAAAAAGDAFANEAIAWLKGATPVVSDDAMRKARKRRT